MMFSHLKIVELSTVLAGPSVGMFFAELGAHVIKLENKKTGGDVTRSWKTKYEDPNASVSAYFSSVNYNKTYLAVDLKDKNDLQSILDLIKDADILITNFKFGDDKKYSLDYDTLHQLNPKLIYGKITGFGNEDQRIAYDVVLQAESGLMSMNGNSTSEPIKMPIALIDMLAAHQLKEGLLTALLLREKDGKGRLVSASLYDSAIAALSNQASNYLMTGQIPQRLGSLHPNIAPYGETFLTADKKYIVLAIGSDTHFEKLCDVLSLSHLISDDRFAHNANRVKNRKELHDLMVPAFLKHTQSEWMTKFIELGIPAGAIKTLDQVFEDTEAKNLILEEEIDSYPTKRVKSVVFNIELHD